MKWLINSNLHTETHYIAKCLWMLFNIPLQIEPQHCCYNKLYSCEVHALGLVH